MRTLVVLCVLLGCAPAPQTMEQKLKVHRFYDDPTMPEIILKCNRLSTPTLTHLAEAAEINFALKRLDELHETFGRVYVIVHFDDGKVDRFTFSRDAVRQMEIDTVFKLVGK